jgi:hypothetical protein
MVLRFIEQELNRARIWFRKTDNAFLAVADVAALQAAADKLSPQIIRKRLDYWTLILGPKFSAKERSQLNLSRFYAIAQIEYCRNFIFKRNFPIHKLFERSCEFGLWRLTADKIAEIFGTRLNRRMRGKLATAIDRIEHGHHVFRAYFKNAFLKQYEKFATFLRNELVSNNLADFRLKKGLDHLDAVRERFQTITARFAGFQAQGSTSMSTFRCCSASPCRSPLVRSAIPASRSTTPASSACSKSSCIAAVMSAAGRPGKSTTPSSPPSTSPTEPTPSTSSATTRASSRATVCYSVTAPATPTVSPPRGFRLRCSFCSSTNGSAARSPTAASTTAPTPITSRLASSKPPTTAPTKPFNRSSIFWPPDLSVAIVQLFLSTILQARI